ncbi:hypothetical protein D3C71_1733960 [compost metagenome]
MFVGEQRLRAHVGADLALELEQQPLGGLLADSRHLDQPAHFLQRHRLGQVLDANAADDGQRRARAHAGDLDQLAEGFTLAGGAKPVQQLRILAHDEMREQGHLRAGHGQVVEGAHGYLHLVAHAMAVHQYGGRVFLQQGAGQFAYH